jgi:hypothetical protein
VPHCAQQRCNLRSGSGSVSCGVGVVFLARLRAAVHCLIKGAIAWSIPLGPQGSTVHALLSKAPSLRLD